MPRRCLAQPAAKQPPEIVVDKVILKDTGLPERLTRPQLAASLKAIAHDAGSDWLAQVRRATREAWQDAGYFQAVASVEPKVSGKAGAESHVTVTIHVSPGPRYRLGRIRIRTASATGNLGFSAAADNKLVFSEQRLRGMIPVWPGDALNFGKVRAGILAIQRFYNSQGYIDVTVSPMIQLDNKRDRVSFTVFLDQGKQYRVGKVTVLGLSASMERLLKSKLAPGEIFDWSRVLGFYRRQQPVLPPHASPRDDVLQRDRKAAKVDLLLDFRACPKPGQAHPGAADGLH